MYTNTRTKKSGFNLNVLYFLCLENTTDPIGFYNVPAHRACSQHWFVRNKPI